MSSVAYLGWHLNCVAGIGSKGEDDKDLIILYFWVYFRYMDVMEIFKPDIIFAIADNRNSLNEAGKRIAKSVDRTCNMLDRCVSRYKGSNLLKHSSALVG